MCESPGQPACPSPSGPSPVDLLLGSLTLQHQPLVGQLQVSGRQVQLLVHFGMLLIHEPQRVQLLGQVLGEEGKGGAHLHNEVGTEVSAWPSHHPWADWLWEVCVQLSRGPGIGGQG